MEYRKSSPWKNLSLFLILLSTLISCSKYPSDIDHDAYISTENSVVGTTMHDTTIVLETTAEMETETEQVTLTADYYYGKYDTHYEGDVNNGTDIRFEISVTLDKTTYHIGDEFTVLTQAVSTGDPFMEMTDGNTRPDPTLCHTLNNDESGLNGYIIYNIFPHTQMYGELLPWENLHEPGDYSSASYIFQLPENTPLPIGIYDINVDYGGYIGVFKKAIEIVE